MPTIDKQLRSLMVSMHEDDRQTLISFAEFLVSRRGPAPAEPLQPQLVPRPPRESVVSAIKRLSASYPMLDKSILLNQTSSLMSQHIMEGRAAADVIDELESLFVREYERLIGKREEADV